MRTTALCIFLLFNFFDADAQNVVVPDTAAPVFVEPETMAVFEGGENMFYRFLNVELVYPAEAVEREIQGKVFIGFEVDESGHLRNMSVIRSVHPLLDDEAMRVLRKTDGKWKPATIHGAPVSSKMTVPVVFSLR
jgi:TonB family protein